MKFTHALSITCLLLAIPTVGTAKSLLSYDSVDKSHRHVVPWSTISGNTSFTDWCATQKGFFNESLDLNKDNILNTRDLAVIDPDKIKKDIELLVNDAFSFWAPDYLQSLSKLPQASQARILTILEQLTIPQLSAHNMYIRSNVISDDVKILSHDFSKTGAATLELNVPFKMEIHMEGNSHTYERLIFLRLERSFPFYPGDSGFNIHDMKLLK